MAPTLRPARRSGALSWTGDLGISVATDPALCDAGRLAAQIERTVVALVGGTAWPDERTTAWATAKPDGDVGGLV